MSDPAVPPHPARRAIDPVLESLSSGVVIHDLDGAIVEWNTTAERLLGLTCDELAGRTPTDPRWRAVHSDGSRWEGETHPATVALRTGKGVDEALMGVHRPDGSMVWLRVSATPLTCDDGTTTGVVAMFADVTAQHDEFRTVEQSEQRFRNAFEGSPLAEAILDQDGLFVDWNPAMRTLLDRSDDDLDGLAAGSLLPAEEQDLVESVRDDLVVRGEASIGERTYIRPDGEVRRISGRLSTIEWPDAGPCVLVQLHDMTEHWRVREELSRSEERFRVAFVGAPIAMSLMSTEGTILEVNYAWENMLGLSAAEAVGEPFSRFVESTEARRLVRLVTEMFADGRPSSVFDIDMLRADGARRLVESRVSVIEVGGQLRLLTQALDITEAREQHRLLEHIAEHDALTDLLNRRGFAMAVAAHLDRSVESAGAVLMVDLDHFRSINDTLGRRVGDEVIGAVGRLLRATLPPNVSIGRLGGDEFGILVPAGDRVYAAAVAGAVLDAIRGAELPGSGRFDQSITASIGISLADERQLSIDDILAEADQAVYEAKENGRDRFVIAADRGGLGGGAGAGRAHVGWAAQLERALDEDRFFAVAEPIVSLADGRVMQHELLIRMSGNEGVVIGPTDFIRVAERLGLITHIDTWMAKHAIGILAERPGTVLEVNLSALTMNHSGFLDLIDRSLADAAVAPERLIFEMTETAAVSNLTEARHFAHQLSDIGCRFALDDFGAGFGGFYYLKYLPFDFLKIDGEFVRTSVSSATDTAIIRSLVGLSRELGKQTIAEFTHDRQIHDHVRALGVDLAQGRFVGPPERLDRTRVVQPSS